MPVKSIFLIFFVLIIIIFSGCAILSDDDTSGRFLDASEIKKVEYIDRRVDFTVMYVTPGPCYVYSGSEVTGNDSIKVIKVSGNQEEPICVGSAGSIEHKQSLWFSNPGLKKIRFYSEYLPQGYLDTTIMVK